MTVNFEQFKWDFIIAPKSYNAYYCSGECSFLTQQKQAHTHLVQMASYNQVTPCCGPRKLKSIDMLYFDINMNVILGKMPGMVVERCGCS